MGDKPLPEQYKKKSEILIHDIGNLADELWPLASELGESVEIECGDCRVVISAKT